jgi:hypothetical protein
MGLRFHKSISILPGVKLNISKTGISASVGGRGATVNIGKGGRVRGTVGAPGTGISYSEEIKSDGGKGKTFYFVMLIVGVALAYGIYRWLH